MIRILTLKNISLAIVLLILSKQAFATTYYVSGSGSDSNTGLSTKKPFRTLQKAANLTKPGDTVYAMNGTYTATYTYPGVLDISTPGTASSPITYTAYPGQTPTISFNGWSGVQFEYTAAYIEVSGFTIIGNNQNVTLANALKRANPKDKSVYDIANPAYDGNCMIADGRPGTATVRPNHLSILGNTISQCGGAGIEMIQTDYLNISGNNVYDSAWYSIYGSSAISTYQDWNSDGSTGYKMFIIGNRLFGNQEFVPWVDGGGTITDGEGIIVDDSMSTQNGSTLGAYPGRTFIANNVLYGNGSSGIETYLSEHVDIVNNSTYQNLMTSVESGRGEIGVSYSDDINVINNILDSSNGLAPLWIYMPNSPAINVNYNIYYNATATFPTVGPNDLFVNPLYNDPNASNPWSVDLSVPSISPAVNAGTSYLAPQSDFSNASRPQGSGYDIGAFEQ